MTDATLGANWRGTRMTHREFIRDMLLMGKALPELFNFPGWLLEYVMIDLMHTGDLGIIPVLLGNVAWELICEWGGTATHCDDQVHTLMCMIRAAAKAIKLERSPINRLTINMIRLQGKPPKLKVNAGEARRLLKVFNFILEHFAANDTDHHRLRYNCVHALYSMYELLEDLKPENNDVVSKLGRQHVILYSEIARAHVPRDPTEKWLLWRMYPKHHLFLHCIEDQLTESGNPRDSWTYPDERKIAEVVKMAESSNTLCLHTAIMRRYRLTL